MGGFTGANTVPTGFTTIRKKGGDKVRIFGRIAATLGALMALVLAGGAPWRS